MGNHRPRTRGAVFHLKIYTLQKPKQNSSAFLLGYSLFDVSSLQGWEQFFRRQEQSLFFITKQKSQCSPMPKKHAAYTLCGKQGLQTGFVHLSRPALPYFSDPLAKWKINHSLLAVLVIIGWMCHQLAHPCSELGKA